MSYLREQNDDDVLAGKEHELTLSTAAIFGIFFGLVVLCAIFFGFGYSLRGSKSTVPAATENATATGSPTNFSAFKPAPGQPIGSSGNPAYAAPARPSATNTAADTHSASPTSSLASSTTVAPIVRVAPADRTAASPISTPALQAYTGTLVVQVAAISVAHPDDAGLMVNALRAKGYAATAHPGPDSFIHILVGPFTTRPAAEAMLKRLSVDGYTAYIK